MSGQIDYRIEQTQLTSKVWQSERTSLSREDCAEREYRVVRRCEDEIR